MGFSAFSIVSLVLFVRTHGMDSPMSVAIVIFVILVGIVWACYDDSPD